MFFEALNKTLLPSICANTIEREWEGKGILRSLQKRNASCVPGSTALGRATGMGWGLRAKLRFHAETQKIHARARCTKTKQSNFWQPNSGRSYFFLTGAIQAQMEQYQCWGFSLYLKFYERDSWWLYEMLGAPG